MKNLFVVLICAAALTACEESNSYGTAEGIIPEAVQAAFKAKYPGEDDPDFRKDDRGNWEAHFKQDGEKWRADFADDGTWVETEASIKYKDLPKIVQDAIEDEYDKDDVKEVELVQHPTKGVFYDVEFKYGGQKWDIEYDASGRIIGREDGAKKKVE